MILRVGTFVRMKEQRKMDFTVILPEECISIIISLTSPQDACRLSMVSPVFKSAADSDAVWEKFLPSDYKDILSNSASSSLLTTCFSKKDLYFHLCHHPIILKNRSMSFSLEKISGKKCFMVGPRQLNARWGAAGDVPIYWILSRPESRFGEVAKFGPMWLFEVKGRIETKILSPKTIYTTFLVFKFLERRIWFIKDPAVKCGLYFEGRDDGKRHSVFLDPPRNKLQLCRERKDGWMEIEMGEFFNENGDDGALVFSLFHDSCTTRNTVIIEGIELRPKNPTYLEL